MRSDQMRARDHARVLGAGVLLFVIVPSATSRLLPVWAWWLVLLLDPVVFAAVLYASASRRSR